MLSNPVLDAMMNRKSIRRFTDEMPSDEVVDALVRAAQQAPFAAQLGSLLLSRDPAKHPFRAPLLFTVLVDVLRLVVRRQHDQDPHGAACYAGAGPGGGDAVPCPPST